MASALVAVLDSKDPSRAPHNQPWLLPSSRRLRNVIGFSLRDLSLSAPVPRRHRGQTADDEAIPNTLTSPAKVVALRERKAVEHSRSSSDLRKLVVEEEDDANTARKDSEKISRDRDNISTPPRPTMPRMRRRSTLEWANATPQKRQERLESLSAERLASVFFTCHVEGVEEPIYISETVPHTMNPTFRRVDLSSCGPGIARLPAVTLRIWTKSESMERWRQLLEFDMMLSEMQYLGKSLDKLDGSFPQNTVLVLLSDGVYTSMSSLADFLPRNALPTPRSTVTQVLPTSSFDALLRLSKLDDSINDALATHKTLTIGLESVMQSNKATFTDRDQVFEARDRLKTIEYARMTVEKQLEKVRKQQEEKRRSLDTRRNIMEQDLKQRDAVREWIRQSRSPLPHQREERDIKLKAIQNQRRRICDDINKCYPILSIPKKSLGFTIRNLYLPNSDDLDDTTPEKLAAALGHAAHVVLLLSAYLCRPLPYPIRLRSSSSTIEDRLSLLKTNTPATSADKKSLRTYPLFTKSVPRFRFDYAVFLLNKDIQALLETAYNVRVVDLRQTLPNLKYLLYIATAGAGDLPARKAGGIRGLLNSQNSREATDALGRPVVARENSDDSHLSGFAGLLGRLHDGANGKTKGAVESLKRNFAESGKRAV